MIKHNALLAIALVFALLLSFGCAQNSSPQGEAPDSGNTATSAGQQSGAKPSAPINNEVNNVASGNPIVVFETNKGTFKAEIYLKEAPISGANFMGLVRSGFYNGLTFHRVEPNFVVQGGDPKGDGTGGSNKTIPLEIKPNLKHVLGALGMARSQNPNSASSQFYVVIGEASFLDGQYAVFGKVLSDADLAVVKSIKVGDRMTKVYEQK